MGKKIKITKKTQEGEEEIKLAKEEDEAREEMAYLEQEGGYGSDTSVESINIVAELEEKESNIKSDFNHFFEAKGKKKTWLETLDITSPNVIDKNLNTDDDIKRELFFYNTAKALVVRFSAILLLFLLSVNTLQMQAVLFDYVL